MELKENGNTYSHKWKEKDERYIKELQKFFDITDNIKNEQLKMDVIYQMIKCEETITKIAEENFENKV